MQSQASGADLSKVKKRLRLRLVNNKARPTSAAISATTPRLLGVVIRDGCISHWRTAEAFIVFALSCCGTMVGDVDWTATVRLFGLFASRSTR